ncbi:MAG: hypothetical protein IKZ09_11305 [Clostridia bacterium]|nr:hypothetical protein [Clostridia bacterium]
MKIDFSRGAWNTDDLVYAYTYRFPGAPEFLQQNDCVENRPDDTGTFGCDWENISMLSKETYPVGTRITVRCAFFDLGAPLITIADRMYNENGVMKYGDYMEVVLYKNGINIWRMHMDENKTVTWKKMLGVEFPVTEGDIHTLSVTVTADGLTVEADEHRMFWRCADIYESFHLGIDACEGLNRFYSLEIAEA